MICLGDDPEDKQSSELLNMLNLLLSEKVPASEKIKTLENDFRIPATKEFKREVEKMCNLSQGIENKGIKKGVEQTKYETVKRLLAMGLSIEDSAKGADLDLKIVKQLVQQLT